MKNKVAEESEFYFTDKTSDEVLTFEPVQGKFVLSYSEDETSSVADSATSQDPWTDAQRGYAVVDAPNLDSDKLDADGVAERLSEVGRPSHVNAVPAMRDKDGYERFIIPDEFAVQFNENVDGEDAKNILKSAGVDIKQAFQTPGFYLVAVPEGKGLFETMRAVAANSDVAFVEPSEFSVDDVLENTNAPSELRNLWGLENTGQIVRGVAGTPGMDVKAPTAWQVTKGSADVIIGVIDTGCQVDHPDLATSISARPTGEVWNFVNPAAGNPTDPNGHGTHVCGTVAAAENGHGVRGLAPRCKLMPMQVELRGSSADYQRRTDAINLVTRKAKSNPKKRYVLNLSWRTTGDVVSIRRALEAALAANVVVVVAAGNDDSNMDTRNHYPAKYPGLIAVAALNSSGVRADFSNYGDRIDIAAPGVAIYSTMPGGTHDFKRGTSMAAPHVAAAAALILSANPKATVKDVYSSLVETAVSVDHLNPNYAGKLGGGMMNVHSALSAFGGS